MPTRVSNWFFIRLKTNVPIFINYFFNFLSFDVNILLFLKISLVNFINLNYFKNSKYSKTTKIIARLIIQPNIIFESAPTPICFALPAPPIRAQME